MVDIKKRKITRKDWEKAQETIKQEHKKRKDNPWRTKHERQWKEVDRQVAMEADTARYNDKNPQDWHNNIELGELSVASEVLSADFRRLVFPNNRSWFEGHVELPPQVDEQGPAPPDAKEQKFVDGDLRSLMTQQHRDFNFKNRIDLSVKEAFHHGSYVAECIEYDATKIDGNSGIENISAPVWQPHSMWNCFPDMSASIIGMDQFYRGSMIIIEYMPLSKVKDMMVGPGWMPSQFKHIPKKRKEDVRDTTDIEIMKFYGDLEFERQDGTIILPNTKTILANGIVIYHREIQLPFAPIIYGGYERMDIRDPYYTSPLIKQSPTQKVGSTNANGFLDAVDLNNRPPMSYDTKEFPGGEPDYAPGAKNGATRNPQDAVSFWTVPDPTAAFEGMQFAIRQINLGTSVNPPRAGGTSDRGEKTAFEVRKDAQGGEIRTIDFIDKFEDNLRAFLYMQHEINKKNLKNYSYYNPEMDAPDFNRKSKNELPKNVHFEVVGSKGILGEEERSEKTTMVTSFASTNELFAPLLNPIEILKEMYMDAGQKNPERLLNLPDNPMASQVQQIQEQAQQLIDEAQQQIQELQVKDTINQIDKAKAGAKVEGLQQQIKVMEEQNQLTSRESRIDEKLSKLADAERLFDIQQQFELDLENARNEGNEKSSEESEKKVEDVRKQISDLTKEMIKKDDGKTPMTVIVDNGSGEKQVSVIRKDGEIVGANVKPMEKT